MRPKAAFLFSRVPLEKAWILFKTLKLCRWSIRVLILQWIKPEAVKNNLAMSPSSNGHGGQYDTAVPTNNKQTINCERQSGGRGFAAFKSYSTVVGVYTLCLNSTVVYIPSVTAPAFSRSDYLESVVVLLFYTAWVPARTKSDVHFYVIFCRSPV